MIIFNWNQSTLHPAIFEELFIRYNYACGITYKNQTRPRSLHPPPARRPEQIVEVVQSPARKDCFAARMTNELSISFLGHSLGSEARQRFH